MSSGGRVNLSDEELAERATQIGSDLCAHIETEYGDDDGLTHGVAAMHASVVCLLLEGLSVDDIVALAQEHATSVESRLRRESAEPGEEESA